MLSYQAITFLGSSTLTSSVYRTEAFILGEGEKKIEEKADTRMYPFVLILTSFMTNIRTGTPSTSIFTINKEDHSVGNLLRGRLLQNRHVTFAAYKVCLYYPF